MARNPYEILGLTKEASEDEIRKAFRRLSQKLHPDNRVTGNEAAFKELNSAFQIIGDSGKRAEFDRATANPFTRVRQARPNAGSPFGDEFSGFQDFSSIFNDYIRSANVPRNPHARGAGAMGRGDDVEIEVGINTEESINGCKKSIHAKSQKRTPCLSCLGTGAQPGTSFIKCKACGGAGHTVSFGNSSFSMKRTKCTACRGSGSCPIIRCKSCDGRGDRPFERELVATIPAAIQEGTKLRFAGMGTPGSPPGDLYAVIKIIRNRDQDAWNRDGENLITTRTISLRHAIIGGPLLIKLPGGTPVTVVVPAGTQPNAEIQVPETQIKSAFQVFNGNVRVRINVELPRSLSSRGRRLLDELVAEIDKRD